MFTAETVVLGVVAVAAVGSFGTAVKLYFDSKAIVLKAQAAVAENAEALLAEFKSVTEQQFKVLENYTEHLADALQKGIENTLIVTRPANAAEIFKGKRINAA